MKSIKLMFFVFFIFTINCFSQAPIIEDVNFCTGSTLSQSISVNNPQTTATYIWQFMAPTNVVWTTITNTNAGSIYEGFSTSVLSITRSNGFPATLTKYRVIATISSTPLTSNESVLIVNPLSIAKTISGASPVCIGGDKTLTYGSGSIGVIQWQSSTTSSTLNFNDIDFENGTTLNSKNIQETTWFRVMNTSRGCNSVYSPAVEVTANTLPVAGDIDGGNITVCKTLNSSELTLYNYEGSVAWQSSTTIDGLYTSINYSTSDIYRANALAANTYFRTIVKNGVCPSVASIPVYINVDPTSVSKSILGAKTLCTGSDITLNYGTGSVGIIQWQSSTTSSTADDFIDVDSDPTSFLIYSEKKLEETTWFRVMNTSGDCSPSFSTPVQVTVNEISEAGYIDGVVDNVCFSSNSTPLILYNSVGNIQWQKAVDASGSPGTFSNITSAIKSSYTASSLTETTYFKSVLTSGVCPSVSTDYVKISVDALPVVKSISGATPTCIGGSKVLVYGSGSIGDIQWQSSTTSGTTGFEDVYDNGNIPEIYLTEDIQETTWYRVLNTNGVCDPKPSPVVRVDINLPPVSGFIEGGNTIVSKNSSSTQLTLKNYRGYIQWQKANLLTDTFIDIPDSSSYTYRVAGLTDSSYFRVIVSNECTKVVSEPVIVNVNTDFKVNLFPNPFNKEFNINLSTFNADPIELKIYDLLGRTIEIQEIKSTEINTKKIGSSFSPGVYSVTIKQGQQEKFLKIIKN